mgnify:CR=1 FL=1
MPLDDYLEEARLTGRALADYGAGLVRPQLRLGVTGLSRSGKTIFITALIHALLHGTRLPVFEALTSGRIARVKLSPQPDAAIPRFEYEKHLRDLITHRRWPDSTRAISEIRIEIEYQTKRGKEKTLTLDIVDYPGEWLLDLLLLDKTYEEWSAETIALSKTGPRAMLANQWHIHLKSLAPNAPANEQHAINAAKLFTEYLVACRDDRAARTSARRDRGFRFALAHDDRALRSLSREGRAAVLPRALRTPRPTDRARGCSLRDQCRAGSAFRSRTDAIGDCLLL